MAKRRTGEILKVQLPAGYKPPDNLSTLKSVDGFHTYGPGTLEQKFVELQRHLADVQTIAKELKDRGCTVTFYAPNANRGRPSIRETVSAMLKKLETAGVQLSKIGDMELARIVGTLWPDPPVPTAKSIAVHVAEWRNSLKPRRRPNLTTRSRANP
jgi:hypothetical protein